jgi:hypothetical protein
MNHFPNLLCIIFHFDQRCPLSSIPSLLRYLPRRPPLPFIFILMVGDLGRFLKETITFYKLHGLTLYDSNHPIFHSQFVDDTMIMGIPSAQEAKTIKKVLNDVMDASGMSINQLKSKIFLFNTPLAVQLQVSHILGFFRSSLPSKYLRVPLLNSVVGKTPWEYILSKLSKALSGYTFHSIIFFGHFTLLKYLLQAIHFHTFSALDTRKCFLKSIRSI